MTADEFAAFQANPVWPIRLAAAHTLVRELAAEAGDGDPAVDLVPRERRPGPRPATARRGEPRGVRQGHRRARRRVAGRPGRDPARPEARRPPRRPGALRRRGRALPQRRRCLTAGRTRSGYHRHHDRTPPRAPRSRPPPPADERPYSPGPRGSRRSRERDRAGRRQERPAAVSRLPDRPARGARDLRPGRRPAVDRRVASRRQPPAGPRAAGRPRRPPRAAPRRRPHGRPADRRLGLGRDPEAHLATHPGAGPRPDRVLAVGAGRVRPAAQGPRAGRARHRRSASPPDSSSSSTTRAPDPAAARALDAYFIVGAEHGLNASTFTARVITSTRSDIASAVCGAIGALKGPLHGGAPAEVVNQLHEIGSPERAEAWVA